MSEKTAIVTAGGSGMGAAAARRLAADGFKVAILSSSGKGEALATELGGLGVTGSNQSNDDLKRLVDSDDGALGPHRRARQQRRPRPARADPRDHRRAMAHRPRRLPDERHPPDAARRADHGQTQKGGAIINISTAWAFEPSADVPDLGRVPRGPCRLHEDLRRHLCRRQRAHEQRAARLDRQPAGDRGAPRERADAALRHAARRSPRPSPSSPPTAPATSPARTSASMAD